MCCGETIRSILLILLPGLDGTGILFQPLIAALPAHIKPIVVSYPPDRCMSYAELLPQVLSALPASAPFILLGESFSGPLAVMAATTRPHNLLGVILCATFVTRPIPWVGWAVPILARSFFFQLFPRAQRVKAIIGGYSNDSLRSLFAQVHAIVPPSTIAFRVRQVFLVDVRQQLLACDVPMLYIAAAKDQVVPAGNRRLIQRLKPTLKVITIAGPHGIPQTRPVESAEAIAQFVATLPKLSPC